MSEPKTAEVKVAEIISDDEITRVHGRANFGSMSPREVVNDGVRKAALGYHSGHTQFCILREHGLITAPRGMSHDYNLTKKGKKYARALMHAALFAPASPPAETGEGEPVEAVARAIMFADSGTDQDWADNVNLAQAAIAAYLKAVGSVDPVAWAPKGDLKRHLKGQNTGCWVYGSPTGPDAEPLYTHPASDQSDTERMRAAGLEALEVAENFVRVQNVSVFQKEWPRLEELRAALAEKAADK